MARPGSEVTGVLRFCWRTIVLIHRAINYLAKTRQRRQLALLVSRADGAVKLGDGTA
jgi:hypothetical protein